MSSPTKYVDENGMKEILNAINLNSFDGGRHYTRLVKVIDE